MANFKPLPVFAALSLVLGVTVFVFTPPEDRASLPDHRGKPSYVSDHSGTFVYHGRFARIDFAEGTDEATRERAAQALDGAGYYAAFAIGPDGHQAIWQRAHTRDGAREGALALCGTDCRIVADLVPETRTDHETRDLLPPHIAGRISTSLPALGSMAFARGGISASGTAIEGRDGFFGRRKALAECEAERAAEQDLTAQDSPPCQVYRVAEIIDLRPAISDRPAPYVIDLRSPVLTGTTRYIRQKDGSFAAARPNRASEKRGHFAATAKSQRLDYTVLHGGALETSFALALAACEANRDPSAPDCAITEYIGPDRSLSDDEIAVDAFIYEKFQRFQTAPRISAFAICPLGDAYFSYGLESVDAAVRRVAEACRDASYRGTASWLLRRYFIEMDQPARIIAIRD